MALPPRKRWNRRLRLRHAPTGAALGRSQGEMPMKLYYSPAACSQAVNISLREAGLPFEMVKVDLKTKKTADGLDYLEVNPKGYVPALKLDNGEVLTEKVAVLQYVADRNPAAKLAPPLGTMERYRLMEWLAFVNSEVHKSFSPLFRPDATEEVKQYTRKNLTRRLDYLNTVLANRPYLMGEQFTVADAYLFVVLSWSGNLKLDMTPWPQLKRYIERIGARPQVIEALKSEGLSK
jgi:glutathione S-transferase